MPTQAVPASAPHQRGAPDGPDDVVDRVDRALRSFLSRQQTLMRRMSPRLATMTRLLEEFVFTGGKRLRPTFCYWGWRSAGGVDSDDIITAAAALELLHVCALLHDDIMDGSETRRGMPTMHRRIAALHHSSGWCGSSDRFGVSSAILLGDLCLNWCAQMFGDTGLPWPRIREARRFFHLMHTEVMAGQYLDLLEQALAGRSLRHARTVIHYKTATYTVQRPLHVGATLAGADQDLLRALSGYALPLGEAFQLRDDLLSSFGDPGTTGKPAGDDLREGKPTVLVALACQQATPAQRAEIDALLGNPELGADGVDRLRTILVDTGALATVEDLIRRYASQAMSALDDLKVAREARHALGRLAVAATCRER